MRGGDVLGTLAVGYLFLGGAGAGAIVVASVLDLALVRAPFGTDARVSVDEAPPCERVAAFALLAGFAALALGVLCLLFDLGRIDRVLDLFLRPSPTYLTVGSFALAVLAACGAFLTLVRFAYLPSVPRAAAVAVEAVAVAVGLVVMVYTGLLLQGLGAVALWRSPFVPVLFTASALATGAAVLIVVGFCRQNRPEVEEGLGGLVMLDLMLVVVEAGVLAAFLLASAQAGDAVGASADALMTGRFAGAFWLGAVGLGLVAPFVVDVASRRSFDPLVLAIGSCCTLAGGICLRYVLLLAAVRFNLVGMTPLPFWL